MMRSLWHHSLVYAFGAVLARSMGLLLLPLIARVLSPRDYGAFDLIVTIGVLVNLVIPLEISQALARLWSERAEGEPRRRLAGTGWTFTLMSQAAFAGACSLAAAPVAHALLGDAGYAAAVRAGACAIAVNGVFYLLQNQFRCELRPRAHAAVSTCYALASLVLVAMFGWGLGAGLEGILWAQALAAAGASAIAFAWLRHSLPFSIAREDLAAMLRFSLPLVPAGIALFASLYANRLMLNALATLEDVGVFGIASRLASIATLPLIGVQPAITPLIYASYGEPETPVRLARLLEGFAAISMASCLALSLFSDELVRLFAAPAFARAAPLVGWLAVATLLSQLYVFAPGIAIAKRTRLQMAITVASAATGIVLNAWLIPTWGAWGATLATVGAGVVFFGAWLAANNRLYPLPLRAGRLITATVLFALLNLGATRIDEALPGAPIGALKAALLGLFVWTLCRLGLIRLSEWRRAVAPPGRSTASEQRS